MISILTPSYQYGHFLPDAVDSVAYQQVEHEHVIVDGGSSDNTVEYLRRVQARNRSLRWVSEPDDGQSDALNKALSMARGDIVGWLNADEFYLRDALAHVLNEFTVNPETDVVYGDALFVDEQGRYQRRVASHPFHAYILHHGGCFISTCSTFIRRSALDNFHWDTRLSTVMDWDMYMHLEHQGSTFRYIPQALGAFRVHDAQVTSTSLPPRSQQHERVRARYGVRRGTGVRALKYQSARGLRRLLKLRPRRGVWSERAERHLEGRDMRWFV